MFYWLTGRVSWKQQLQDDVRAVLSAQRSLKKSVEDLLEAFEEKDEDNSSQIQTLKAALESKTKFIESSFSNVLDKTLLNGHSNGNGHDKDSDNLVDITKLSSTMQTMIRNKLKEAGVVKKLP